MRLFDLHCDSPSKLFNTGKSLDDNDLHISFKKAAPFHNYIQCSAVWCDSLLSDRDCFEYFQKVSSDFRSTVGSFITSRKQLMAASGASFILTVEDSRLVSDSPENVSFLYENDVRVMTLLWAQNSSVGGGWNANGGLTATGREILENCFDTGIIPDISHANDISASYMLERSKMRKRPVIATHSNSRSVCNHLRNLTDETARLVADVGGIIGISLYPPHLRGKNADISDIIKHIEHYISILGSSTVCLGCDFDGIDSTPDGISHIGDLTALFDKLGCRLGYRTAENVFFNNAYNFFINNLPEG